MGNKFSGKNEKAKVKKLGIAGIIILIIAAIIFSIAMGIKQKQIDSKANLTPEQLKTITYEELKDETVENCENVSFGAFFAEDRDGNGQAERILGTCNEVGSMETMYIDVGVNRGGTLKNGVITINSRNFSYRMQMLKDSILKKNYVSNNVKTIELNDIESGNQKLMMGDIYAKISNADDYTRINYVTLTGTWVSDEVNPETGEKDTIEINETREITVDWYGTANTSINTDVTTINLTEFNEKDNRAIEFDFTVEETRKQLLTKENNVTVTMPSLYDNYPTSVECKNQGVSAEYDEDTHTLTISKNTTAYSNTYTIVATYPEESYDKLSNGDVLVIPVKGYYKCYNNQNEEFDSINDPTEKLYITNTAQIQKRINFYTSVAETKEYMFSARVFDKEYVTVPTKDYAISKQKIIDSYNNENSTDGEYTEMQNMNYIAQWSVARTGRPAIADVGIIMSEPKLANNYGDTWDNYEMADYISNTGIFFTNKNFITEDGYIQVFDNDTDRLVKEFSYSELNTYNSQANAYKFGDEGVKHIRIETSSGNPSKGSELYVYSIKEVNTSEVNKNFTKQQMESVNTLKTNLNGKLTNGSSVNGFDQCKLVAEQSYASIDLSQKSMSIVETTPISQNITIQIPAKNVSYANWKDGVFLVEVPSQITYMTIEDVVSSYPADVKVISYDLVKENGKYLIKIITENETPLSGYNITIKSKMLLNPTQTSSSAKFNLYSYNPNRNTYYYGTADIYDVNGNENIEDTVGLSSAQIGIGSLNTFITAETISDYNAEGEITVAPNVADVLKGTDSAKINVSVINNYSNTVENIAIVGKIPFEGNTYINGSSLGSKFTANMSEGISVPSELENVAKVYYSTNETPEQNLGGLTSSEIIESIGKEGSDWVLAENVSDLSTVKSYLIVIEGSVNTGKSYTFSYKVAIPSDVVINDAAYSCHIVSYEYNTDGNGTLPITVQPNKVGLKVTKYYDMEIIKYKEGTSHPVQGAIYEISSVEDEEEGSSADTDVIKDTRILTSTSEGKLITSDLRINQIYSIKEVRAPGAYELNNEIIEFKVTENALGVHGFEKISESGFATTPTIDENNNTKPTLKASLEDTPKFALNITKTDAATGENLSGIIFAIDGKQYITGNGKATVNHLKINTDYVLKETYASGYYPLQDINFKLVPTNNGGYELVGDEILESIASVQNNEETDLIQVNINLTNETIPTYKLKVVKVNEVNENDENATVSKLQGARFLLRKIDDGNSEYFTTDENGEINISNLYEYVEGKSITGEYVLKETIAPEGYMNNNEEIHFFVRKNVSGELELTLGNHTETKAISDYGTVKNIESLNDTITLTIQDKPLFKLTKIDAEVVEGENGEQIVKTLPNAEFIIYELNDDGTTKDFAKGINGEYVGRQNSKGNYVVTTDSNGIITAGLKAGNYKIVESKFPEGYEETPYSEVFTIAGEKEDTSTVIPQYNITVPTIPNNPVISIDYTKENTLEIYTINDLVDLALAVNGGNGYSDTKVKLMNDLDFNEASSYKNSDVNFIYDDGQGGQLDLNGDGVVEGIQKELTTGSGFMTIGANDTTPFKGVFDGKGDSEVAHEIKNLYIDKSGVQDSIVYAGLFGYVANAKIENVVVSGTIKGSNYKPEGTAVNTEYIGGIAGVANGAVCIENCRNNVDFQIGKNLNSSVGGILGNSQGVTYINKCSNDGEFTAYGTKEGSGSCYVNMGGIEGRVNGMAYINECTNTQDIKGGESSYYSWGYIGGILGYTEVNTVTSIDSCTNNGNISSNECAGGLVAGNYTSSGSVGFIAIKNSINKGEVTSRVAGGVLGEINNASTIIIENATNTNKINASSDAGGIIGFVATVNTLNISDVKNDVTGTVKASWRAGGIASYIGVNNGIIKNTTNLADVTSADNVGGLLATGRNGTILFENCSNTGTLSNSSGRAGGIIAEGVTAYIKNCANSGDINYTGTSSYECGGIASWIRNAYIEDSYNTGNITAKQAAGIIGIIYTSGSINRCYNTGTIITEDDAAGIAIQAKEIKNSFNQGNIYPVCSRFAVDCAGIVVKANGDLTNVSNFGNIVVNMNAEGSYTNYIAGINANGYTSSLTNCNNSGHIKIKSESTGVLSVYLAGISTASASSSASISKCYNTGTLEVQAEYAGNIWIGGVAISQKVIDSYNSGNINFTANNLTNYTGIGGVSASGRSYNIEYCYNTGNINVNIENLNGNNNNYSSQSYIGGIHGFGPSLTSNVYNTGDIVCNVNENAESVYVGGIGGYSNSTINNVYNTGSIYSNVSGENSNASTLVGLKGNSSSLVNAFYKDDIEVVGKNITKVGTPYSEEYMKSEEFYKTISNNYINKKWVHFDNQYPTLDLAIANNNNKIVDLTVKNTKKQYDITTQIGADSEGEYVGGTITGEASKYGSEAGDKKLVETVKYGNASSKAIKITPDTANGYRIKTIAINDEKIAFQPETDGSYTIPAGYFKNVKQNNNIVATFVKSSAALTINKKGPNGEKVQGATFKIESDNLALNRMSEIMASGSNYFADNGSGGLQPNSVLTSSSLSSASSYYEIDLTDNTEDYYAIIGLKFAGPGTVYAAITESADKNDIAQEDIFMRGGSYNPTVSQRFASNAIHGGKKYYLHLWYDAGSYSGGTSGITLVVDHVDLVSARKSEGIGNIELVNVTTDYYFEKVGDIIRPTNYNVIERTSANSYIPINLTGKTGKYAVKVNATNGPGTLLYGQVTTSTTPPSINPMENMIYMNSSETQTREYVSQALDGGQTYYLHLGYSTTASEEEREVQINSITLLKDDPTINSTIKETDINGQIVLDTTVGEYKVTELEVPDGYILDNQPHMVTVSSSSNNTVNITNEKMKEVVVHFYEKETGEAYNNEAVKVKEDEYLYGSQGEKYNTTDNLALQIGQYSLAVNEDNEYIIPENSTGEYGNEVINVYYYYETKDQEITNLFIRKIWNTLEDVNDYRATIKVYSVVAGRETPLTDEFGDDLELTIQGNGAEYLSNLPKYENNEVIEYKVEEIKIEKRTGTNYETQEDIWEEIPLEQFKGNYKIQ